MILPGSRRAQVSEAKVRKYLLSSSHPLGKAKADFFKACGFSEDHWQAFALKLVEHAQSNPARLAKQNIYGTYYEVDGDLDDPAGKAPPIRSIWMIKINSSEPTLITAYPLR